MKKIKEEREIVEKNGYKFEIIWTEYYDNEKEPKINGSDKKRVIDEKIKNKISTLNNNPSKISKINNKKVKIE